MTQAFDEFCYTVSELMSAQCTDKFISDIQQRLIAATGHPDVPGTRFRASKIGTPWVTQVLDQWFNKQARTLFVSDAFKMLEGILAQEVLAHMLLLMGYKFNAEVTVTYGSITGHADIIVRHGDNEVFVVECKSMAPHLVTAFKNNPHDDYGYLSQLSFYWHCACLLYPDRKVSAAFAVFDRGSGKFHMVPITAEAMSRKVARIDKALSAIEAVPRYDFDMLLSLPDIIPPVVAGKIPANIAKSRWSNVLYKKYDDGSYGVQAPEDVRRLLLQLMEIHA